MTPKEYWNGPPKWAVAFRKAYETRMRTENMMAWRNGLYVKAAIESTVGNIYRKKGTNPIPYPDEPFPLTQSEADAQKAEKERIRQQQAEARIIRAMRLIEKESGAENGANC